ncbi:molecular chaperone [Gillisia sp. Q332]|uniref:fimbrial biogenesis chaperone n=1 Tax=Gillisia xinjiangensis TaxID=3384765 RepID=UPI00391CC5A6
MILKLLQSTSVFLLTFFLFSTTGFAQGDLMIMPKRLVFDGSQRSQEINLANTGSDSATYAISIVQYKMTESGNFEEITEPEEGQRFATDFLRYYPRQVVLGPNEAQTVRLQLTRTGNLEQGEYRSHIYFRAVEKQTALGEEDQNESEGISINIKTVFGISIPVIIREGASTTAIELSGLELNRDPENPVLSMVINRTGNMSVYGELSVQHISPEGLKTEIGKVKGLAVYTPNTKRDFAFKLQNPEMVDLIKGKLNITYKTEEGKVLGESQFNLD